MPLPQPWAQDWFLIEQVPFTRVSGSRFGAGLTLNSVWGSSCFGHTLRRSWRVRSRACSHFSVCVFCWEKRKRRILGPLTLFFPEWLKGKKGSGGLLCPREKVRVQIRSPHPGPLPPTPPPPPQRQHWGFWAPVSGAADNYRQELPSTLTGSGLCVRILCQERVKGLGLICPLITVKRSNESP